MVFAAAGLAQYWNIGKRLALDVDGSRIAGTVTRVKEDRFRIRYTDTEGTIRTTSYRGGFGLQDIDLGPAEEAPIELAYDPESPHDVQPATISYLPAAVCGGLFLVGMTLVLQARSAVRRKVSGPA